MNRHRFVAFCNVAGELANGLTALFVFPGKTTERTRPAFRQRSPTCCCLAGSRDIVLQFRPNSEVTLETVESRVRRKLVRKWMSGGREQRGTV